MLLTFITVISLFPAIPAAAAGEKEALELAYEVDFRGTNGIFEPTGVSGAYKNFTYTPSADGRSITVRGKDYADKDPNGIQEKAFWGGTIKGLTAGTKTVYELEYKVRNDSTKNYSQVGIGGLVPETGVLTSFWNVACTYNAAGSVVLGMLTGNTNSIGGSADNKKTIQQDADRDAEGFISMKIAFNGPSETMVLYTKVNGEWVELYERAIEIKSGSRMGVIFYSLRSGAINMVIKDMKIYANGGKKASTDEVSEVDDSAVTGYTYLPKEMTLAEVKPRFGIEKKIVASAGVTSVPTFRNEMDAYVAEIPHQTNGGVALTKNFTSNGYKNLYVTFSAAIDPEKDTALNENPGQIRLDVSKDGKTWVDSGVTFDVKATGEYTVRAKDVPEDSEGNYLFGQTEQIPVYQFTSSKFNFNGIKNIRLVPTTGAAKGTFRLVSLYVWGDTGETIKVPLLDGNQNPTVKKTVNKKDTDYVIYKTNFEDTDGWVTNAVNWREKASETIGGETVSHCYFNVSGVLPVMDGMNLRLYSPDMELDASQFNKITVDFKCFRIDNQGDPKLSNMRLGYSTDNGNTWTTIDKKLGEKKVKESGAVDGSGYETYSVSFDVKKYLPTDETVTNIVLMPYGEKQWYRMDLLYGQEDLLRRYTGPMVNSKGAFRILDFSITGTSANEAVEAKAAPVYSNDYDSTVIQLMIDTAKAEGKKEVTIPSVNPRDGSNTWIINQTIKVPSDMTLYINNCVLRMADYAMCRMIQNQHCPSENAAYEDRNIHIIGVGNAVLQGGLHNGIRTELVEGSTLTTWNNMTVVLQNVNNFSVENLRIEESRFYSVAMYYCSNGKVDGIDLFNSRKAYVDGMETWEQDGIDIRPGTHHVWVNDITGRSGDDSVALVAIRAGNFKVVDKPIDIHDITITNIATKMTRLRMNVRITSCNGIPIYNVLIDGMYDTQADFGGKYSKNTIQVGNSAKGYIVEGGRAMQAGEIHDIYMRNVTGSTQYPIGVRHNEVNDEHWAYEFDTCSNQYSGDSSASLISDGDQLENTVFPVSCQHNWARELKGTQHLQGLPAEAASLKWLGCTKCNAIKRPEGVDAMVAKANAIVSDVTIGGGTSASTGEVAQVPTGGRFIDVAATSPYKQAIDWAVDEEITVGKTANTFEPNTTCTRANIITFIWRANGSPEPLMAKSPYVDADPSAYYYKAALWASEKELLGSSNRFAPNQACTRADTVTYLWKLAGMPHSAPAAGFTDVKSGADYAEAVAWAVQQGVTTGVTETTFVPNATCTRGQIVTFLYRALVK